MMKHDEYMEGWLAGILFVLLRKQGKDRNRAIAEAIFHSLRIIGDQDGNQ